MKNISPWAYFQDYTVRKKIAEHMMPSVGTQLVGVQIFSITLQIFSILFLMGYNHRNSKLI